MAFHDYPIVDKNSERSEESVLQVRGIFTRKEGFISREETPDNGVDLNIELIASQGATSNIFAIQIKSTAQINVVRHGGVEYISIEFKTSRLGHLCRRPPAYGLVTIYDEASRTTYYDFVEEIVIRLTNQRGSEEWKSQEVVSIGVPLTVLNHESAAVIHRKMSARFQDHSMLLHAFGDLYRIPSLGVKPTISGVDINDPKQVEKFLVDHGLWLFNSKDYEIIIGMFGRLTSTTIVKSKQLTLLAAITFGQTGMTIEGDYYLQRSRAFRESYDENEVFLLDYTALMVRFKRGEIDHTQFQDGLILLRSQCNSSVNSLNLDINLIYTKFLQRNEGFGENPVGPINEIFLKIEQSSLAARDKLLLKLFNLENLHTYGTQLYLRDAGRFKVQESIGIYVPMSERLRRVQSILDILNTVTLQNHTILKESIESKDKLVNAFAAYYKARFFFMTQFQTMMLSTNEDPLPEENHSSVYENNLNFCYQSVGLFIELSMLHEAHQSVCCAYDLQILHNVLYKSMVGSKTITELEETMRKIELETGLRRYESIVESTFNSLTAKIKSNRRNWENVPDEQVESFARIVLDAYEIPKDRLVHIITDINAHKVFYRECTNPDLELLQDLTHLQQRATIYATPPIFLIRSKISGIESKKSTNINELLQQFSTILKKG